MDTQLRDTINEHIAMMINSHVQELDQYLAFEHITIRDVPDVVMGWFSHLATICEQSPENVDYEVYRDARLRLEEIENFVRAMNQDIDPAFAATETGRFVSHCAAWCQLAAEPFRFSLDDVWDIIAPVVPDHMEELSEGVYEAQWWYPVPRMDVEILMRTEGITLVASPFEPSQLPGGLSVRFAVSDVIQHREATN